MTKHLGEFVDGLGGRVLGKTQSQARAFSTIRAKPDARTHRGFPCFVSLGRQVRPGVASSNSIVQIQMQIETKKSYATCRHSFKIPYHVLCNSRRMQGAKRRQFGRFSHKAHSVGLGARLRLGNTCQPASRVAWGLERLASYSSLLHPNKDFVLQLLSRFTNPTFCR